MGEKFEFKYCRNRWLVLLWSLAILVLILPMAFLFVIIWGDSAGVPLGVAGLIILFTTRFGSHIFLTETCTATFYDDRVELTLNKKEHVINYLDVKKCNSIQCQEFGYISGL